MDGKINMAYAKNESNKMYRDKAGRIYVVGDMSHCEDMAAYLVELKSGPKFRLSDNQGGLAEEKPYTTLRKGLVLFSYSFFSELEVVDNE